MLVLRPFRGLRFDPARVPLPAVVGPQAPSADPRHVLGLLALADGGDAAAARARFHVGEWRRARVLVRDPVPALYAVRVHDGEQGRLGVLAALDVAALGGGGDDAGPAPGADETAPGGADRAAGAAPDSGWPIARALLAAVASFDDARGRIAKALDNETEREPDCTFRLAGPPALDVELWVLDDDSAVARIVALLEKASPRLVDGQHLAARARAAAAAGQSPTDPGVGVPGSDVAGGAGPDVSSHVLVLLAEQQGAPPPLVPGLVSLPLAGAL